MKEKLELRKIREFGEIINDTFAFIKQNFKPLMKSFFVLCGFFILASIVTGVLSGLEMLDFYSGDYRSQSSMWTTTFLLKYIAVIIFAIINFAAFYVTILSYMALYIAKGNFAPTVEEVWSYFKFYFFRVLFSNVAVCLFIFLAFVCCVIPGIYIFPAMTLFFPVMILENASFGFSLNRSFQLIKEHWWTTAATLFVIYLITYVCTTIIQLPSIILLIGATLTHTEAALTSSYSFISVIFQQIAYIFYIIPIVASALIYFNLVERKESAGLFERMETLGTQKQENNSFEEY